MGKQSSSSGKTVFLSPDPQDRQRVLAEAGVHERMVRERERQAITGLGRTQWWQLERRGLVPARLGLCCKCRGWRLSDLLYWMEKLEEA